MSETPVAIECYSSQPTATGPPPVTPSPTPTYTPIAIATATATPFISPTTPPPSPRSKNTWLYIAVAFFGVFALAYFVYPKSKLKVPPAAQPTFYVHSDWKAPQTPPHNLAINYELHFHPNVSRGQHWLQTDGPTLILRKTKQ